MNYMLRETACISQFVLASKGVGSIQRILSPIKLKSSIVVLPPRDEQDQIVRYLDWQVSKINRLLAIKKRIVLDTFDLIQLFYTRKKGIGRLLAFLKPHSLKSGNAKKPSIFS